MPYTYYALLADGTEKPLAARNLDDAIEEAGALEVEDQIVDIYDTTLVDPVAVGVDVWGPAGTW